MNRQGSLFDLILFGVIALVIVVFFAFFLYMFGQVTDKVLEAGENSQVNISEETQATFVVANSGFQSLKWISYSMIIAIAISILISSFLVRTHPVFFFIYVIVIIVSVVFAIGISNAYGNLLQEDIVGPILAEFSASSWIILHLPIIVTVIGFIGAILLFVNMGRDPELGGGI